MKRVVLLCNGACCVAVQWSVLCCFAMERFVCYCVMQRVVLLFNGACCIVV